MKPINVLVLITVMDRAGAETVVMNYMRNMNRDLVQYDFLINRPQRAEYEDEIEKLGGKVYHMCSMRPGQFLRYKREIRDFFRSHKEYSVVHSHLEERSCYALRAAREAGINIRICHGHSHPRHLDIKLPVRYFLRRRTRKYCTHMMACSTDVAKWLFGKKKISDVIIVKNAVDTDIFTKKTEDIQHIKKELGIMTDPVIGHVGRFTYEKNHKFLLEIFSEIHKRNSNAILLLIGGGSNKIERKNKKDILKKIVQLNIENSVIMTGVRDDVERMMQVMDVLVMPSTSEGFPVTLVEAQSVGLRCVASTAISDRCNISGTIEYLPLSENASYWAEKILQIINVPLKRSDAVLEQEYDIRSNAEWLQNFYIDEFRKHTNNTQITKR